MKTAMKLTIGILATAITMTAASAWSQNPDAIDNARSTAKSIEQKQAHDADAAVKAAGVPATKPAAGAPAPAVKAAVIPAAAAAGPAANQLQRVNLVPAGDSVRVEITANHAVTPKISKLDSPARLLVELPATTDATPQNHIAFGNAGVKGVRIGTDGKTPPTTSVVVDLDKACSYEMTPGSGDKLVLTLHTNAPATTAAKNAPAAVQSAPAKTQIVVKTTPAPAPASPVKAAAPGAKPQIVVKNTPVAAPAPAKVQAAAIKPAEAPKAAATTIVAKSEAPKPPAPAQKTETKVEAKGETKQVAAATPEAKSAAPATAPATAATEPAKAAETANSAKPEDKKPEEKADEKKEDKKPEDKKWAMSGKRDPFFSPVVQQGGSGCTSGKKCLEIGTINLRGVVKSDSGFIAVVTNNLNKAYFLRENDPVFNGYVLRITGDSVVFQETVQDKLGKSFTREVVKRIFTPAV